MYLICDSNRDSTRNLSLVFHSTPSQGNVSDKPLWVEKTLGCLLKSFCLASCVLGIRNKKAKTHLYSCILTRSPGVLFFKVKVAVFAVIIVK